MARSITLLVGKKQMEEIQSVLKALEEGNTNVFREDRTLILSHNTFNNTVMKILNGDKEV